MTHRIEIVIEFTDMAWAGHMEGDEDYTPTEEDVLEYFVEYVSGADMSRGVTYSGRVV